MSPHVRRIIYVVTYEVIAILVVTGTLVILGFGGGSSGLIAVVSSTIALIWNYVWTTMFEAWEKRQKSQDRTVVRRIIHAVGFEGGLIVILVPIIAWVLQIALLDAFILEISLLVFFLVYTFVFAWLFDIVLPLKRPNDSQTSEGTVRNAGNSKTERVDHQ